jgi:hypothetical protein
MCFPGSKKPFVLKLILDGSQSKSEMESEDASGSFLRPLKNAPWLKEFLSKSRVEIRSFRRRLVSLINAAIHGLPSLNG